MVGDVSPFSIKTDVFEGPLELLLDLIEKRKMLINDISLAAVTDEYIARVQAMQEHPVGETAQFVLVASTLLLIKSKSLLPILELTSEESGNIEDLEYRLRIYQTMRNAARDISAQFGRTPLYERTFVPDETPIFTTDKRTTIEALVLGIDEVLKKLPRKKLVPKVTVRAVISLDEMITRLHERITRQFKLRFADFAGADRGEMIVGFLAVLELVKQGTVMVRQEGRFSDIHIERESVDTPKYS